MADNDVVRQRIITSVFGKRPEENYSGHLRILEDAEDGTKKPRYIILSQTTNGLGYIHKSKLNTNGTFSVGKTWKLSELRAIEVLDPHAFNITMARTYRWETDNEKEQAIFLASLVKLFRAVTGGASLDLSGMKDPDAAMSGRQAVREDYMRNRTPTPPNGAPVVSPNARSSPLKQRSTTPTSDMRSPPPRVTSPSALSQSQHRRPSPAYPSRSDTPDAAPDPASSAYSNRPSSPPVRSQTPTSSRHRRPSNASSTRPPAASPLPSIGLPSSSSSSSRTKVTSPPIHRETNHSSSSLQNSSNLGVPSSLSPGSTPDSSRPATSRKSSRGPSPSFHDGMQLRGRDPNARISFFDPANQATLDRLLSGDITMGSPVAGGPEGEAEGDDVDTQATMASVEEMLEGYEWASEDMMGRKRANSAADQIESRLLDELMALEKANVHSFIESDDRVAVVLKYLDEAIQELDTMDSLVSSYKIHLNAVSDDISYIQGQNRGLQVQTQNQRALLNELEQLLQTVHVDREALITLTQESLEKPSSIQRLEEAATELYRALLAGRDTDMAATMERLDEYRTHNAQFCKRIFDYLSIMFIAQGKMLLGDTDGITKPSGPRSRPAIINHQELENYLGRYSGLILYLKESDEGIYAKLCATYFSTSSDIHNRQVKALLLAYANVTKAEEDNEHHFGGATPTASGFKNAESRMRRAGTIVREGRKDKDKPSEGDLRASEAFGHVLEQVAPQIYREDEFITDFLQINEATLTFADYMGLDNYFRRQASRYAGLSQSTLKLVRGAMDLIFGFLPGEFKMWIDAALVKDNMQIIGIIACLERFQADADERGNAFFLNLLDKQHMRLKALFERHVKEQIKSVEETKITSKKRQGVVTFIKYFPVYVGRVENQLIGADSLEIRHNVDMAYEKIVQVMFDSLKQMAKMEGEEEDKGQLNYHVILIENMHHFVAEMGQVEIGSVSAFVRRAETLYDENLSAYVKMVLRRPFAKIIDYFEGVERLLKTVAPTEVPNNSSYNRSSLKKVVKDYNAKDVRKHVDALFARVEKHFTEASEKATTEKSTGIAPGTVMVGVWKACEEELLRITELFTKRISQCYADSGVSLEYTAADVEAAFRRHRVGG